MARPELPNSPQKKQSMESWRFCHNVYTSPLENAKFTQNKNDHNESWYKSLVKNAKITENKNDQCNHSTNLPLEMRKSTKTKTINGIMQIFRKKREDRGIIRRACKEATSNQLQHTANLAETKNIL